MAEEPTKHKAAHDAAVLDAQYRRSLSSFEGIMLAQIEIKTRLSNRLNWTIRAGLILLGVIAFSILILLLTLSSQINRMSDVVININEHFESITGRMDLITASMGHMEKQVALLETIDQSTGVMDREMGIMQEQMRQMSGDVGGIRGEVAVIKDDMGVISSTIGALNMEVGFMGRDMRHMSKPARSLNKIFPFP